VPLFAKGSCADAFPATALNVDPQRGNYTDNAIVGNILLQAMKRKKH